MCEFCTKHGEGKKWYLQMKNYAEELLHEELSSTQKEIVNATTRLEWNLRFFENFVMPAITGLPAARNYATGAPLSNEAPKVQRSEYEIVEDRKVIHFGQCCPSRTLRK